MSKGVYELLLADGKYYVGYSANVEKRIKAHFNGNGSEWTRKHKPKKVLTIHRNATEADERMITKSLMASHGVNNVRGGGYTQSYSYPKKQTKKLQKSIQGVRCKAKTKSGNWCKASPIKGTEYCMFHRKR